MVPAVAAVLALLAPPPVPAYVGAEPAIELGLRTTAGLDQALAGEGARLYRAQPELVLGVRSAPHLDILAGGGVGPVYVVRPAGGVVDLTVSATLGLHFQMMEGANVLALARAEALAGGGVALTLHVRLSFDGDR
jgi:hypothetical protein